MENNKIKYNGIWTNNLKGFNFELEKKKIISIAGPSGSGKSSLAYGTIYSISEFEENKLHNMYDFSKFFKVDSYENIICSVDIKQINLNNNPRSTIATYLNLDKIFKIIFGKINKVSPSIFTFNTPKSSCSSCYGLGYIPLLNNDKIIDEEKSIEEGAFIPWKKTTLGYEEKLLKKFADDNNIPTDVKLLNLTQEQREILFYCKQSDKKYKISYKAYGKPRNKEFYYTGILLEKEQDLLSNKASGFQRIKDYSDIVVCPICNGKRFDNEILKYKVFNKNIGELYMLEISELYDFLKGIDDPLIQDDINSIIYILKEIIDSDLEYLYLNRGIPTLSGGELQRIRLVSILNSKISDMLYVIDEPSAKLHVSEYDKLFKSLEKIRDNGNTILLVEHNPYFLDRSDKVFYIGPGAGIKGGYLTSFDNEFDNDQLELSNYYTNDKVKFNDFFEIKNLNRNNLKNISVKFPKNAITGIYGISGSGKSSLCKEISKYLKTEYISQKPIRGSNISTIGTYTGTLFKNIREEIAKKLNLSNSDIFNFNLKDGQCPVCNGNGKVEFEYDFGKKMKVICESCDGKRYSKEILENPKYRYNNYNIYEILNLTLDELLLNNMFDNKNILSQLELLKDLGLGHLNLFRTTNTLSGGEAQRVKLSKVLGKKINDKIIIFDEPLSGLSKNDCRNILKILRELLSKGVTILFIEHNILGINSSDYIIEMGPRKGKNGGEIIFEGSHDEFINSNEFDKYRKFF